MKSLSTELNLLRANLEKVLPNVIFDPDADFFGHGGDSLHFVSFVLNLSSFIPEQVLEAVHPELSMQEIAFLFQKNSEIQEHSEAYERHEATLNARGGQDHVGPILITANRHSYLFRMPKRIDQWILVSDLYEIILPYDPEIMRDTLNAFVRNFDGIRLRLKSEANGYHQELVSLDEIDVDSMVKVVAESGSDVDANLRSFVSQVVETIDTCDNPFNIIIMKDSRNQRFGCIFVCHHIITDAVSNGVIRNYILDTYLRLASGYIAEPSSALPYSSYCNLYYEDCIRRRSEGLKYWEAKPWDRVSAGPFATFSGRCASERSEEVSTIVEQENFPEFCKTLRSATGFSFEAVVLASIAKAYGIVTDRSHLCLGLVTHGRGFFAGRGDTRRTVGWISEVAPAILSTRDSITNTLLASRDSLAEIERFGRLYSFLRHLDHDDQVRRIFAAHPYPNMTLNILSGMPPEPHNNLRRAFGWDHNWRGQRAFAISGGLIRTGKGARLSWDFDTGLVATSSVETFLAVCDKLIHETVEDLLTNVIACPTEI